MNSTCIGVRFNATEEGGCLLLSAVLTDSSTDSIMAATEQDLHIVKRQTTARVIGRD
jgi:hypothetical protein